MSKKEVFEYLKTFFLTLIFITVVTLLLTIMAKENATEKPLKKSITEYKFEQTNLLIEQYKYEEKASPFNYVINIELGLLYESLAKLNEAEQEYQKAIKKSPYGIFEPKFLLAELYIKERRFTEALELIGNINEYPNQSLIASKAIFYEKIAKAMYEEHQYANAVKEYKNSFYYRNKTLSKLDNIEKDVTAAFIARADEQKDDIDRALITIEDGLELVDSPELLYKLALLNQDIDPQKSLEIYSKLQKTNPSVIDYDTYFNFLDKLKSQAQTQGDEIKAQLYEGKIKKLQRFVDYNITYPDDFEIKITKTKYHQSKFGIDNYIEFEFEVQNKAYKEISKLFTYIEIYNNNKLIDKYEKRIIQKENPLKIGRKTDPINIKVKFTPKNDFIQTKDVTILIFLTKNKKVDNTFMTEILIPKT